MKKKNRIVDFNTNQPRVDSSPIIPQRSKFKGSLKIYKRELTDKQKQFLDLASDKNTKLIFVSGPAGTSKTFLAVLHALTMIDQKRVSDLIYIRSVVESAEKSMGYLPGEVSLKLAPYLQPLLDKMIEMLPKGDIDVLTKEERVTGIPLGHLRGLNFNSKVIIADEAQNMTFNEIFTLITRTGEFSKVFILGDPEQSDINGKSGFIKMIGCFDDDESRQNGIRVFRFTVDDIVRSGLVKFIINKIKKAL